VTGKFISPRTLLDQVWNTAPFLRDRAPEGFLAVLRAAGGREELELVEYFTLCLAAHHATVATYVPTDVDSKIRGLLWRETRDPDVLDAMLERALAMRGWSVRGISARWDDVPGCGQVSGHNGEWLSVMAGALGRLLTHGREESAGRAFEAIDAELEREALAFRLTLAEAGREIVALKLAMSITHNLGDLDQGISFWENPPRLTARARERFGRLAHENRLAYQGTFQVAAHLYRVAMATEGHRHYPLREVRALRQSPDLLLPLSPFLDDWGALLARHPALEEGDRSAVVEALVNGCHKVPNQLGYYRALAGFQEAAPKEFERACGAMANSARKLTREGRFRQLLAVPRGSFESMMRKKALAARVM
jgi:hypothetical protein